ncbi:acetyl-CoA C-acetyltransferase [Cryobacterium sp. TMT1-21]|uniref:acetyl-CoA C-acetyltransferase n=1 Tax=unclassified Cryobacterium TaxID=2649013 RepID=UPI00106B8B98|nr:MULTISPECIES: acetyl-CoA C-acetyltransferase [unclassified Cryobacterium]TFC82501.1 acetyl-CoA C-acetyltransferase [Cryobacterium sp. TmT2-59]TFD18100.1 acetyl-CoA C-acetyltransferase [Cryobacterium sp. TMT1-21]TFD19694.1 acetyl-CoA C-acetyltransferase [Cryobacterium sp. TMT4-10]TFD20647.1 acetyl-CoA C-acetyltransferase [Cryobacterium sp. TMT2-23]TFD41947.1 acetyl-CoA C-acetyltransferase [Cryobacterium sp. TMT2-10]
MSDIEVVILAGSRTPQGRVNGQLSALTAVQLGTAAIVGALARAGVAADEVDAVLMGQVLQAGCGQNPARQSSIGAGIPWNVPAMTVNKVCLSGLAAIIDAARLIRLNEADVVVAGGQESMSRAPHLLPGSRQGWPFGSVTVLDHAAHDGLTDAFDGLSMGLSTEHVNTTLGIGRADQDAIAAASHQRAAAAAEAGLLDGEITPISVPQRKGEPLLVSTDEGVRGNSTPESLGRLRPAFAADGTVTAGNSSPLSDGASAVVLSSRRWAEDHGLSWLAVVEASGQVAGPDNSLHSQPANAIMHALDRQGWAAGDLDLVEINEAFAAVALESTRELGISADRVNIHGGAIAIGHPIGASGGRLALHAALELARRGSGKAAVALCGGGGQGDALLLSR